MYNYIKYLRILVGITNKEHAGWNYGEELRLPTQRVQNQNSRTVCTSWASWATIRYSMAAALSQGNPLSACMLSGSEPFSDLHLVQVRKGKKDFDTASEIY